MQSNKYIIILILVFNVILFSCFKTSNKTNGTSTDENLIEVNDTLYPDISINPHIRKTPVNREIIKSLRKFLSVKNVEPTNKELWKEGDYEKYMLPYKDIFFIEKTANNEYAYRPTVLEISELNDGPEFIVKTAFMLCEDGNQSLRCIYNMIVDTTDYKFKRILEYNTQNWAKFKIGTIDYIISPKKDFNKLEAFEQDEYNKKLAIFFDTSPKSLSYYSCVSPKEIFEIKGFDYLPNMYISEEGGLNEFSSHIIFSGNNSERYDHEFVHSYLYDRYYSSFGNLILLHEGLATYFGGSGEKTYSQLRSNLKDLLDNDENLDLAKYFNPYSPNEQENEISYTLGAVICEKALREKKKEEFLKIYEISSLREALKTIGIEMKSLKQAVLDELNKPVYEHELKNITKK